MVKVNLMKMEMDEGKPWTQQVRDEAMARRREIIRAKHRAIYLTKQKAMRHHAKKRSRN